MLDNVTNRNSVPAPRLVLDPVYAMWRTKIKWFRPAHTRSQDDATNRKRVHFRLMILPDATHKGAPLLPARSANGRIRTRLQKIDKKGTGTLVDAQERWFRRV